VGDEGRSRGIYAAGDLLSAFGYRLFFRARKRYLSPHAYAWGFILHPSYFCLSDRGDIIEIL
jgi:hypothetical protein